MLHRFSERLHLGRLAITIAIAFYFLTLIGTAIAGGVAHSVVLGWIAVSLLIGLMSSPVIVLLGFCVNWGLIELKDWLKK